MKKKLITLIGLSFALSIVSCGKSDVSPESIIDKLQKADYPINNVISYTESNDPNELLGRPGQYTQKINFADLRLEQQNEENPIGGSIEVFKNKKDCQDRVDYLEEISQSSSYTEYNCQFDNILLRLNKGLTSDDAESYVTAVQNAIDGKELEKCIISSEDTSSIFVYFNEGLSDDDISQIVDKLEELSGIMKIDYISPDEAWKNFSKIYLGEDNMDLAEGFFMDNPTASSAFYSVTAMNGNVSKLASEIEEIDGIEKVEISKNEAEEPLTN